MSERAWLVAYLAAVVVITLVHQPMVLGGGLIAALVASGPARWQRLRRTVVSVLAFNLTVSLGYLVVAAARGEVQLDYLVWVNLRVVLLVYLAFWVVARVNLVKALDFAPTLAFLATLAAGQARAVQRLVSDFRLAFASRNPVRPRLAARTRHAAAQGQWLVERAMHAAGEASQAMRSRGGFDD